MTLLAHGRNDDTAFAANRWPSLARGTAAAARAAALGALLGACSLPPAPPTEWSWYATVGDTDLAAFRDARTLLDGVDAPRAGEHVAAGDCALFGVCLLDGGERREWFLRLTALADEPPPDPTLRPATVVQLFASSSRFLSLEQPGRYVLEPRATRGERVRIEVFDGDLAASAVDEVAVTGFLFEGGFAGCREAASIVRPPKHELSAADRAHFALSDVVRIVRETPSLMSILREVASLPPLWTLLHGVRGRPALRWITPCPSSRGAEHPRSSSPCAS